MSGKQSETSSDESDAPNNGTLGPDSVAVQVASVSDIGMRRQSNQDSYRIVVAETEGQWKSSGHMWVVADGMGAHAAGELASQLAVDLIPHHYGKLQRLIQAEALVRGVVETNSEIYRKGQANPEFRSMGTTASVLTFLPEGAVIAHVGDSRVYRLRGSSFEQLTFDHSLVWEMMASGGVSQETVDSGAIPKNVITRSLGPSPSVQIDLEGPYPLLIGDRFLLCSDGLTGQVEDDELSVLLQVLPLEDAARVMVDLANLRGGPDNITVVLAEVRGDELVTTIKRPAANVSQEDNPNRKPFSLILGVVAAVCLLTALVLAVLGQIPIAIVSFVLGLITLVTGFIQMNVWRMNLEPPKDRYGRGPYRRFDAKPNKPFVDKLAGTIAALLEAATSNKWPVNWDFLNQSRENARRQEKAKNWHAAVQNYSAQIQHIMQALRQRDAQSAGDSSVDL